MTEETKLSAQYIDSTTSVFEKLGDPINISFMSGGKFDSVIRVSAPHQTGIKIMKAVSKILEQTNETSTPPTQEGDKE